MLPLFNLKDHRMTFECTENLNIAPRWAYLLLVAGYGFTVSIDQAKQVALFKIEQLNGHDLVKHKIRRLQKIRSFFLSAHTKTLKNSTQISEGDKP
jgi:hypothetical protein